MPPHLKVYVAIWSLLCLGAIVEIARQGRRHPLLSAEYRRFLGLPWKLVSGVVAGVAITVMAPFTGDPTWDHVDAFFMAVLTFWTAPWAVGIMHRAVRGLASGREVYVAACAWMFSASWSYDLYLLLRDGRYPVTWAINIAASSVLYASAGLLWNLSAPTGQSFAFAFRRPEWLAAEDDTPFRRVAWVAIPFMLLAVWLLLPFLLQR